MSTESEHEEALRTCACCGIDYEPVDQIGLSNERCPECESRGSGERDD